MKTSDRCPKCGSTEISLKESSGKLQCHFCRHIFEPELISSNDNVDYDSKNIISEGAQDIDETADKMVSLKCEHCGAEVTVNLEETTGSRCHWCRNNLSIDNPVPSGAVPDIILPFKIQKETARNLIESFSKNRRFFAHPKFIKEFTTENIIGVYFPYFLMRIYGRSELKGMGEVLKDKYEIDDKTYYDADVYSLERKFDIKVNDLTMESSADKSNFSNESKTNNVINAIMPFDTQNSEKYKTHYTRGYNIENRSLNVKDIDKKINTQMGYINKFAIKDSIKKYNRGVNWHHNKFIKDFQEIKTAYFPVWLYSYMDKKSVTHYIAVNARTEETMGSIPINFTRLGIITGIIEIIAIIILRYLFWYIVFSSDDDGSSWPLLLLLSGPIFFAIQYARYRNFNEVHKYEEETDVEVDNLVKKDSFVEFREGLKHPSITGRNDNTREIDDDKKSDTMYALLKLGSGILPGNIDPDSLKKILKKKD